MTAIGVILNPHAGGNRGAARRRTRLLSILGEQDLLCEPRNEPELIEALGDYSARDIGTLAICGGDGSVSYVMTRALRIWGARRAPRFLLLRGGTINNLARSLGTQRRSAEAVLASVVAARSAGRELDTCELDLMCVNGSEYGYTVGAGMIVRFLDLYYASGRPSPAVAVGLLARLGVSYLLRTAAIERLARPVAASVICDGEAVPFSAYTLLVASTIPHLGLGARPFYSAGDSSGRFHLLAGDSSPGELLLRLPQFFVGRASGLPNLHDTAARRVRIEFAEPQAITINGDVLQTPVSTLDIEAGPSVTFIRPPASG